MKTCFLTMGVMNITPNSFSDGGQHFTLDGIADRLEHFQKQKVAIIDIGAESTAPMNQAISEEEEKKRLELFLKIFKDIPEFLNTFSFSLDTYKPDVPFWFLNEAKRLGLKEEQFIWNDISGAWDGVPQKFLRDYPKARYVFCHNEAPRRLESSAHMDHVLELGPYELTNYLKNYFSGPVKEVGERLIIDPCWGFSKTFEQNMVLLKEWPALMGAFPDQSLVIGVSKKSFLRRFWQEHFDKEEKLSKESLLAKSEFLHLLFLKDCVHQAERLGLNEVIFRVHDPVMTSLSQINFP